MSNIAQFCLRGLALFTTAATPTGSPTVSVATGATVRTPTSRLTSAFCGSSCWLKRTAPLYRDSSSTTSSNRLSVLQNVSPLRVAATGMEVLKLPEHFIYHRQQQQQYKVKPPQRGRRAKAQIVVAAAAVAAASAAAIAWLVQNWQDDLPIQVQKLEERLKQQEHI